MPVGVEKVDSGVEGRQHTDAAGLSQLRALIISALVAVSAAVPPPLGAQQEQRVVRGLSFVGNHAIDDYALSTAIATTSSGAFATKWWLRWLGLGERRYFDELEFRRDVVRLLLLYRQGGYVNAVVDTLVRRTAKDVWVTFRITEGEPLRVTKFDLLGLDSAAFDLRRLRRALPLQVGDPFDRFLLQASADTLARWLRNRGYPWTEVLRNFDADAATKTAQVSLEAVPGPSAAIGEIAVRGVRHVDTTTVLRMLAVHPHDPYHEDRLYQSQRDLYSLGTFGAASVSLLDSAPPPPPSGAILSEVEMGAMCPFECWCGWPRGRCTGCALARGTARWTASGCRPAGRRMTFSVAVGRSTSPGASRNLA
jgi:outer membrane protein assembly factor BamA